MALVAEQLSVTMRMYPSETSEVDVVGEGNVLRRVYDEFGKRMLRGTALAYEDEKHECYDIEHLFREVVKGRGKALEIGTFRGVSTTILGHYYDKTVTIDILGFPEALALWKFFGVEDKIAALIVKDDEMKAELINSLDFNFAFIDADHGYEGVAFDFELVKRCGHVVFHDYGFPQFGVTEFVDSLPKEEVTIKHPFAIWKTHNEHC